MMFTAAFASDRVLRDALIAQLHDYASAGTQFQPFEVVYNPITGDQITGSSRFAHFHDTVQLMDDMNKALLRVQCSQFWLWSE